MDLRFIAIGISMVILIIDAIILSTYKKYKIDEDEIEELKKVYNTNNTFNIFKKTNNKIKFLFVISFSFILIFMLFIIFFFNIYNIIVFGVIYVLCILLQFFYILCFKITLRMCKCPICNSKLESRVNIKKYKETSGIESDSKSVYFNDVDIFFSCSKCGTKIHEHKSKYEI